MKSWKTGPKKPCLTSGLELLGRIDNRTNNRNNAPSLKHEKVKDTTSLRAATLALVSRVHLTSLLSELVREKQFYYINVNKARQ